MVSDPPTLLTRGSRVRVIRDQTRLEALCSAKDAAGWNALMAPTLGRQGEVLKCDAQGDFLVRFEGKGEGGTGSAFFGGGSSGGGGGGAVPVSFYYPPQALRLVGGGEPAMGARVRVRAWLCIFVLCERRVGPTDRHGLDINT